MDQSSVTKLLCITTPMLQEAMVSMQGMQTQIVLATLLQSLFAKGILDISCDRFAT